MENVELEKKVKMYLRTGPARISEIRQYCRGNPMRHILDVLFALEKAGEVQYLSATGLYTLLK